MLVVLGVVLCLQGASPLVQELFGQDSQSSMFLVNLVPNAQPFASLAMVAVGLLLLAAGRHRRTTRAGQGRQ